jgi:hypothetical protein
LKERDVPPTVGDAQKRGHATVIDEQALQGEDGVLDVEKPVSPQRKSPARQAQASPVKATRVKDDETSGSPSKWKLSEPTAPVKPSMSAANLPTFSTTRTAPAPVPVPQIPALSVPQNVSPTNAASNHPLRMLAAKPPGSGPDPNAAASEIKRKLVERLLRVDSELLKQALSRDSAKAAGTGGPMNPIMFIPSSQQTKTKDPNTTAPQPPKKKAKPAHYIRASPHENELVDLTNRVVNPDDQVLRLKRKLAVRKVKMVSFFVLLLIRFRLSA